MAQVSLQTISRDELRSKMERNPSISFEHLEGSPIIRKSFSSLLRFDESSAIKAYVEHWSKIYKYAPGHVVPPIYLVSDFDGRKERVIGVVTESSGEKSLSQYVAAREPIAQRGKSESHYSISYSLDHLRSSIERLHNKFNLYHGNIGPDELWVSFESGSIALKLGKPIFAMAEAEQKEFADQDYARIASISLMLRIEDLEKRGQFLSDKFPTF
ncbi:MAG: hypothetical protein KGH53_01765 [Candidatus Micrarchaeota archaeon]|nr:hypothetical protein [Candidatus Micrarchaeota archaeon]